MEIQEKYLKIVKTIPQNVQLVVVSKTHSTEKILEVYHQNHKHFGENKIQEMRDKYESLPKDIQWHMIGHVQTNKVKYIADFVSLIHAVDSQKLLFEINKQAKKHGRIINCLLQLKIAEEESKFGLNQDELIELLQLPQIKPLENVNIVGLMGMASFTSNQKQIQQEFKTLNFLYQDLVAEYKLSVLSMGMSGDYQIAIETGSNLVRVGSAIFGHRLYQK